MHQQIVYKIELLSIKVVSNTQQYYCFVQVLELN